MHALLLAAALTLAASPAMIGDLNDAPRDAGTASSLRDRRHNQALEWDPWIAAVGARAFFEAAAADGQVRLWVSDGTPSGTAPLAAIDAQLPFVAGERLFFQVRPDGRHNGIWQSDGSAAGTAVVEFPKVPDTTPDPLGVVGSRLLFANSYGGAGREPWITDGSAAGTMQLADINPLAGSSPDDAVSLPGRAVFTANSELGRELWATDGTAGGTALVADLTPGPGSTFQLGGAQLLRVGDAVLFPARGALWRSDGTTAGTASLTPLPAARLAAAMVAGGRLVFQPAVTPPVLWASDGTAAGSEPIAAGIRLSRAIGAVGRLSLFLAVDGDGEALWASDGTATGTRRLRALRSDPTRAFTAACLAAECLFAADDGAHGVEAWRSDGSAAGTALVADLLPGAAGSHAYGFAIAGARAVFLADDGTHGIELWQSDGTAARRLADLAPGATSSALGLRDEVRPLLVTATHVLLGADDGVHGREPWAMAIAAPGDCGADGVVSVDELVRIVGIALGLEPLTRCAAADANGDGAVSIDEITTAIAAAL